MKKAALLVVVAVLALAGCGGGHKQSATGSVHPVGWGQASPSANLLALPRSVPSAEMFDTITLSTVPAHPFALAGYTAGYWPTYLPLRQRYPSAHTLSIAISARYHADCLDVEPGDAVPSQAGSWSLADIRAGFSHPCVYADLSEMPAVRASLAAAGLSRSQYFLWLAWYRYVPGLVAGYDAVQWTDRAGGVNLDESTVTLAFLTIAQPPYVAPKPKPKPPVCVHRRMLRSQCSTLKAKVASDNAASAASWAAWHRDGCPRLLHRPRPYVRKGCAALAQRGHYFTGKARALEASE